MQFYLNEKKEIEIKSGERILTRDNIQDIIDPGLNPGNPLELFEQIFREAGIKTIIVGDEILLLIIETTSGRMYGLTDLSDIIIDKIQRRFMLELLSALIQRVQLSLV